MVKLDTHSSLSRRDFLRLATALGGAAALASFLEGCSKAGIDLGSAIPPTATHDMPTLTQEIAPTNTLVPEAPKPTETNTVPSATPTPDRTVVLAWRCSYSRTAALEALRAAIRDCSLPGIRPAA